MESTFEPNRLRYAGRIPQETLDYLSEKRRVHTKLQGLWHLSVLVASIAILPLMIRDLCRSSEPSTWFTGHNLLFLFVDTFLIAYNLRRVLRSYFA